MSAQDPPHPLHDPDSIYDTALERAVERAPTRFDRFVLRITKWFGDHTIIRLIVVGVLMVGAVAQAVAFFVYDDEIADDSKAQATSASFSRTWPARRRS